MAQYLSDEWMQQAAAALASSGADLSGADEELLVQYDVAGSPDGKRSYALRFGDGTVSLEPGPHPDASVTFGLEYEVAARIARGELSAQAAFMQGTLKLGGDVNVLIRRHALLDGLDDALADLRSTTEY